MRESIDFIAVVHVRREVLDAVQRRIGDAVEMLDGADTQLGVVSGGRLFDADVCRSRQRQAVRFAHDGLELIAVQAAQLEAVRPLRLRELNAFGELRGRETARSPEGRVQQDARRDQFACGARRTPPSRFLVVRADIPEGRDPRGQIEVQFVLKRLGHARSVILQMRVGVDDAGEHVLAGRLDDGVRAGFDVWRHARDAARLHEDIHRTEGWLSVSVHHHRLANQQARHCPGVRRSTEGGGLLGQRRRNREQHQRERGRDEAGHRTHRLPPDRSS